MNSFLHKSNKKEKNEKEKYPKINIEKNFCIQNNDYSIKKFGSVIQQYDNIYLDVNKLFSKNRKTFLNQSFLSKKGSSINNKSLIKTTEENLIQSINENGNIYQKESSKKTKNKLENKFLKNVIKFYQKFFSKENELIKENEDNKRKKNKSSTKIINIKLIEEIEKERNKLIAEQNKNTVMISSSASNIPHLINNRKRNKFFQFGGKTKKKVKNLNKYYSQLSSMNHLKGKINNISKINNLKIKSLKKVNSDISKQIRNSSVIDIKKEIKEL